MKRKFRIDFKDKDGIVNIMAASLEEACKYAKDIFGSSWKSVEECRKICDEELIEYYKRLKSVWKVGKEVGMSGQQVHERLKKHNVLINNKWTKDEEELLIKLYKKQDEQLFLDMIAKEIGRPRSGVACKANELGLTSYCRPRSKSSHEKRMRNKNAFSKTKNGLGVSTKGGFREDIGIYVRSRWEANYARYLNFLKDQGKIEKWEYESETFEFHGIKKGTRFYTPDFKVFYRDKIEYHEVKGYMTPKARTALNRMAKYYPDAKIIIIDKTVYYPLRKQVCRIVKNWEESNGKVPFEGDWTEEEKDKVVKMWEEGIPKKEIAKIFGRTEIAVSLKAQRLGARRPNRA